MAAMLPAFGLALRKQKRASQLKKQGWQGFVMLHLSRPLHGVEKRHEWAAAKAPSSLELGRSRVFSLAFALQTFDH